MLFHLAVRDARAQVALAAAQLDQARAQLEQARQLQRDSIVRAPIDGEIHTKYINEGAYVEAPTAVFAIVDNNRLELESMVASSELASIRAGQQVAFTVAAWPNQPFHGAVIEINPMVQAETRSAKIRIRVGSSGGRLKAGMFAQGEILTGLESHAITIPVSAVYRDDRSSKASYVFVVEDARAVRRNVVTGREHNSVLEVVSGLKRGETLITEQSIEIADGVPIEPQFDKPQT